MRVTLEKITPKQHFTEPPPRYSEASIVKTMEELGIGTSTYARTVQVLKERDYVSVDKKRLSPTERGHITNVFLVSYFEQYVERDFTSHIEQSLDKVSRGEQIWTDLLTHFWNPFKQSIDKALELKTVDVLKAVEENIHQHLYKNHSQACSQCHEGQMHLRMGKFGPFLGCNRYPECKHIVPLGTNTIEEAASAS